ncbi:hypothetical protein BsWGS_21568 [Bradybaena similaris]
MVPGSMSKMSSFALVVIQAILYCVLQTTVSGGIIPYGHYEPFVPHVPIFPSVYYQQPELLTSGAAPVLRPLVQNIFNTVGSLTGALGLGPGANPGRPSLPQNYYSVRQPDLRPGTPNNSTQGNSSKGHEWSYDDSVAHPVGPLMWHKVFPKCGKSLQSPIDLSGYSVRPQRINPMYIRCADGAQTTPVRIKNDGASVSVKPTTSNVIIDGGSLPGQFVVTNVHFHWSNNDMTGSEHKLAGRYYPMEMHVVTFNRKYRNMQEASGADDGIHVIAVLYEISKHSNVGLSFCTSKLDSVVEIGSEVDGGGVDVTSILPAANVPMFRYRGSLTTPPCTENIIWSVYASPQVISVDQLRKFQRLKMGTKSHSFVGPNIRPIQPVNNRVIFTNSRQ